MSSIKRKYSSCAVKNKSRDGVSEYEFILGSMCITVANRKDLVKTKEIKNEINLHLLNF